MTFLNPIWLILIPVIMAFSLWSGRRTRLLVAPDWELFRRALDRMEKSTRGRRAVRGTWKLIPPILLILALSDPVLSGSEDVVILLDRSAGGGVASVEGTRIERSLAIARRAHPTAEVRGFPSPPSSKDLSRPSGVTTTPAELLDVATALAMSGRTVVIATWRDVNAPLEFGVYTVHDTVPNGGIAAINVLEDGSVWVRVAGTPGAPARRLVAYSNTGAVLATRDVATPSAAEVTWIPSDVAGLSELRLEPPDADPTDDRVFLRGKSKSLRIAMAKGVAGDIARALRSIPGAEVVESTDRHADLAVGFVGTGVSILLSPDTWPADLGRAERREVRPGIVGAGGFASLQDNTAQVGILWAFRSIPEDMQVLMRAGGEPLLLKRGNLWVLTGDSATGDWSTRAIFPRWVAAVVATSSVGTRLSVTRCGELIHVPSRSGRGVRTDLDGTSSDVISAGEGLPLTSETPGVVRVSHDSETTELAFAVLSDAASRSMSSPETQRAPVPLGRNGTRRLSGFLFWLAAAAAIWLLFRGR